jgi:hypothetical protein
MGRYQMFSLLYHVIATDVKCKPFIFSEVTTFMMFKQTFLGIFNAKIKTKEVLYSVGSHLFEIT